MTLTLILCIVSFLTPVIIGIIGYFKQGKAHKKDLEKKDATINQLRKAITDMVELEGDKKDVEIQKKEIKKNVDDMSDTELSIVYANQLPNMPRKSRRTRKKS